MKFQDTSVSWLFNFLFAWKQLSATYHLKNWKEKKYINLFVILINFEKIKFPLDNIKLFRLWKFWVYEALLQVYDKAGWLETYIAQVVHIKKNNLDVKNRASKLDDPTKVE